MLMLVQLHCYHLGADKIEIFVPDAKEIQFVYEQQKNGEMDFPYWSQVWPAAIALSEFIVDNPVYVKDKRVLELGAGLGLPSFTAANWANDVYCSDYHAEAVAIIKKTIAYHQLQNMRAGELHWQKLPENISAETLLLSDVNYNPQNFDALYEVIQQFLNNGTCIILSTPQRLLAKPFIEKLLPWCVLLDEREVTTTARSVNIGILVLKRDNK